MPEGCQFCVMERSKNPLATSVGVGASSEVPQLRRCLDKAGVLRGGPSPAPGAASTAATQFTKPPSRQAPSLARLHDPKIITMAYRRRLTRSEFLAHLFTSQVKLRYHPRAGARHRGQIPVPSGPPAAPLNSASPSDTA